jgi:hypothetical protein
MHKLVHSMHAHFAWIALGSVAVAAFPHDALAQDLENETDGYIAGKLAVAFGGAVQVEVQGMDGGGDDMEASYGINIPYTYALHDWFALGTQLALQSWTTSDLESLDIDRSVLVDIALVPQGKTAVSKGLELYVSMPVGVTFDFFSEARFAGGEVSGGLGFNLGLFLGMRVALAERWGLLGELGYSYHQFSHSLKYPMLDQDIDLDIGFGQFGVNLGAYTSKLN